MTRIEYLKELEKINDEEAALYKSIEDKRRNVNSEYHKSLLKKYDEFMYKLVRIEGDSGFCVGILGGFILVGFDARPILYKQKKNGSMSKVRIPTLTPQESRIKRITLLKK